MKEGTEETGNEIENLTRDFVSLLENTWDIIYFKDTEGKYRFSSQTLAAMTGFDSWRDIIGKKDSDLFPPDVARAARAEDKTMLRDGMPLLDRTTHYFDTLGKRGWLNTSKWPVFKGEGKQVVGIFGIGRDISERIKTEDSIKRKEERLLHVISGANAGTWEWNVISGDASFNDRWAEMAGYTLDELKPFGVETWNRLSHPEEIETRNELLMRHINGKTDFFSYESRVRHKDGHWIWVIDRGKVIERDEGGNPLMMFGTRIDISERKNAEERIRKLLVEKDLLLHEVHHRIKNNMNTMISLLSLQVDTIEDEHAIAALSDAQRRLQSMGILYDKLYRSENVNALPLSDYLIPLLGEILEVFPNASKVSLKTEIGDFILGIKILLPLGIIVNELITNIMKYAFTDRDSGVIRVTAAKVSDVVTIAIEDDGVGMPAEINFSDVSPTGVSSPGISKPGFGIQLVAILASQIEGSVRIERGSGTRIVLEFHT